MIEWTTPTGRVVRIRATCKDCGEELVEVERATCANDGDGPHPHARCISPTCFVRMPKGWAACLIVTLPEEP